MGQCTTISLPKTLVHTFPEGDRIKKAKAVARAPVKGFVTLFGVTTCPTQDIFRGIRKPSPLRRLFATRLPHGQPNVLTSPIFAHHGKYYRETASAEPWKLEPARHNGGVPLVMHVKRIPTGRRQQLARQEFEMADNNSDNANQDRRREPRHLACFPAYIEDAGVTRSAIIRDLSITGARLLTRARPEVGDRVRLSLYITANSEQPGTATGNVVRVEPWGDGSTLWSFSVAVEFDEPATEHEEAIKALAERQAKLGLFKTADPERR